jgi:hypothetical protein
MKNRISLTILPVLACLALSPQAHAICTKGCDAALFNTFAGDNALISNTTGAGNSAFGWQSLSTNTIGNFNTGVGGGALSINDADSNTAVGAAALLLNTSGTQNTAVGTDAMALNDSGSFNTANGAFALFNNTEGSDNTATGDNALLNNTTGSDNIALGSSAGSAVIDASNVIAIGSDGGNVSDSCFIGNIRDIQTQNADAIAVVVDSAGQLGTISSSQRFKTAIRPMSKASEALLALKPVTFHYKTDKTDTPQFGLIAEEVAKVNPDLVVRDKNGEIHTVRYEAVNAMLLNEFLKEHRVVQEQGATIARQQKQIEALTAGLQKVNAQLEVSKPAPQTVLNSQ